MKGTKRLLVFASGGATDGGSGFEQLVLNAHTGVLDANIVGVVSNHENGGVAERARRLDIPFFHMAPPYGAAQYQSLVSLTDAEWVSLSGWLKLVRGLDPRRAINIHPGPLPRFGGKGMHGHHVHEAVLAAYRAGTLLDSAVSMHFVTEAYDEGPVFFRYPVEILPADTPETLGARVNKIEHGWQAFITNLVLQGEISWDGSDSRSLCVPSWYRFT